MNDTAPQPADSAGQGPRRGVDRATGRHVIARLAGPEHDAHGARSRRPTVGRTERGRLDRRRRGVRPRAPGVGRAPRQVRRHPKPDTRSRRGLGRRGAGHPDGGGVHRLPRPAGPGGIQHERRGACPGCAPLEMSICKFTVASGEPLVVDDTRAHPLLADHPVVRNGAVLAYAGIPVDRQQGLCRWDVVHLGHSSAALVQWPDPDPQRSRRCRAPEATCRPARRVILANVRHTGGYMARRVAKSGSVRRVIRRVK